MQMKGNAALSMNTGNKELAIAPRSVAVQQHEPAAMSLNEMMTMADMFCKSGMFGDVRDAAKAFVKIQAGREIGVPPFAAMRGVSIIQGQAALGATLVAGRMKAHGYDWNEIRRDNEVCELEIIKPNGKRAGTSKFTMDDAKAAGLNAKDNWKKYPRSMLFARCITDAARTWAPEVFSGIPVYTAEELGSAHTNEDGESTHVEALPDPVPMTPAPKTGSVDMKAMLVELGKLKDQFKAIDALKTYYSILGAHGFEHANEIRPLTKAREIYREMRMELQLRDLHASEETHGEVHDAEVMEPVHE